MTENLRKTLIYIGRWDAYWRAEPPASDRDLPEPYPLNFRQRLTQGHFRAFDREGLPVKIDPATGTPWYHVTHLCAFALAHWNRFRLEGDRSGADIVIKAADRLLRLAELAGEGRLLAPGTDSEVVKHIPSAMNQGEAMSVLCRAWALTGRRVYRETAAALLEPFFREVGRGGVTAPFSAAGGVPWYEEHAAVPLRHILNGMIYSLLGLRDLHLLGSEPRAGDLFRQGVDSVARALPRFDTGRWSLYWVSENPRRVPDYIASMMYHNLHIVQLEILERLTGRAEFGEWSRRWRRYAASPWCRVRAALKIASVKLTHATERGGGGR